MFQKGDRVRHINDQTDQQYGLMEIWEIKNSFAVCRYGEYYNLSIVTFPLVELKRADK